MPRIHVLLNHKAGSAQSVEDALRAEFSADEFTVHTSDDIAKNCRHAIEDPECRVLVAAGGDGTINAVATQAIKYHKTLGVIPAGTLNHFAKDLGLPQDQAEAIQILRQGHKKPIDYLLVGQTVVLNNASLGAYPKFLRLRQELKPSHSKWVAALIAGVKLLSTQLTRHAYRITINGRTMKVRSNFIFMGNNDYHVAEGGLGGRVSLTGGRLTLMVYRGTSLLGLLHRAWLAFRGQKPDRAFMIRHAQGVTIASRRAKAAMSYDGELTTVQMPINAQLITGGLMVLTGRATNKK